MDPEMSQSATSAGQRRSAFAPRQHWRAVAAQAVAHGPAPVGQRSPAPRVSVRRDDGPHGQASDPRSRAWPRRSRRRSSARNRGTVQHLLRRKTLRLSINLDLVGVPRSANCLRRLRRPVAQIPSAARFRPPCARAPWAGRRISGIMMLIMRSRMRGSRQNMWKALVEDRPVLGARGQAGGQGMVEIVPALFEARRAPTASTASSALARYPTGRPAARKRPGKVNDVLGHRPSTSALCQPPAPKSWDEFANSCRNLGHQAASPVHGARHRHAHFVQHLLAPRIPRTARCRPGTSTSAPSVSVITCGFSSSASSETRHLAQSIVSATPGRLKRSSPRSRCTKATTSRDKLAATSGAREARICQLAFCIRIVDPVVEAAPFQGVVHLPGAVRGDDHDGRLGGLDGSQFRDRDLEIAQRFQQERLERLIRPVQLVDQQDRRSALLRLHRFQQWAGGSGTGPRTAPRTGCPATGPAPGFGQPDLDHLRGIVPLVDGRGRIQPLVALQPDQTPPSAAASDLAISVLPTPPRLPGTAAAPALATGTPPSPGPARRHIRSGQQRLRRIDIAGKFAGHGPSSCAGRLD